MLIHKIIFASSFYINSEAILNIIEMKLYSAAFFKISYTKKYCHFSSSPKNVWTQFYDEFPKSKPQTRINIKATTKNNECFIYNSLFIRISIDSSLYFKDIKNNNFLISDCLFNNCSSNNEGGALYFLCDSSIIQYRSCGYNSKANKNGQHSYVQSLESSNNKNYLFESSFYECGIPSKWGTNYIMYGNIKVNSINTSFCSAKYGSGIFLWKPKDTSNITLSSFCNISSTKNVIKFDCKNGNHSLKNCNILNNECPEQSSATFTASNAIILIENCSFLGNTGQGVEFQQDNDGSITIKDSFCDRKDKTKGSVISNNVQNKYSIHNLSHFSSYFCERDYPTIHHPIRITNSFKRVTNHNRRR